LLLKGFDEIKRHLYFPASIILALATTILVIAFLWKPLKIVPKQARQICYYLECPALLLTAYLLYLEGKGSMPHIFLIAGIMYPVVGYITSKKAKRFKRRPAI